jgi:hypothetical protein
MKNAYPIRPPPRCSVPPPPPSARGGALGGFEQSSSPEPDGAGKGVSSQVGSQERMRGLCCLSPRVQTARLVLFEPAHRTGGLQAHAPWRASPRCIGAGCHPAPSPPRCKANSRPAAPTRRRQDIANAIGGGGYGADDEARQREVLGAITAVRHGADTRLDWRAMARRGAVSQLQAVARRRLFHAAPQPGGTCRPVPASRTCCHALRLSPRSPAAAGRLDPTPHAPWQGRVSPPR